MRKLHIEGAHGRWRLDLDGQLLDSGACEFAPEDIRKFCAEFATHNGVFMIGDNERYVFAVTELTDDGMNNYYWLIVDNVLDPQQVAIEPRVHNEHPAWTFCPAAEVMAGYFRQLDGQMKKNGTSWPADAEQRIYAMGDIMLSDEPWGVLLTHQFPLTDNLPDLCFRMADGSMLYITPDGLPTTRYPTERLSNGMQHVGRDFKLDEKCLVAGTA